MSVSEGPAISYNIPKDVHRKSNLFFLGDLSKDLCQCRAVGAAASFSRGERPRCQRVPDHIHGTQSAFISEARQ